MPRRFVVFACCFCCLPLVLSQCHRIKDVLDGLEKVLDYIQANKRLMNLDAVFGLVLGQAQMVYLISHKLIPKQYIDQSLAIESKLSTAVKDTKAILQPSSRNQLFMDTVLAVEAWIRNVTFTEGLIAPSAEVPQPHKINTHRKFLKYLTISAFKEQNSDDCIVELLQQQRYCCVRHACIVSEECYKTMRLGNEKSIDPAYGVTHSLLFLQIARSQMCRINEKPLSEKIRRFCSYILWELRKSAEYGFPEALGDLILEQVTLCGYEGFSEFFAKDIIEHVLSIQLPSGCFGDTAGHKNFKSATSGGTKLKRESNLIAGNCIDHTTGLGASTLALTLRFLFQQPPNTLCDHVNY